MIILGIDPGTRFCGYGIIEIENFRISAAGCDSIDLSKVDKFEKKLIVINQEISRLIKNYRPDIASVETIFSGKNIKSAFLLGHLRGVILYTLAKNEIQFTEYSPKEIKMSVVGNGNATKNQVRFMLKEILNIKNMPKSVDASDALAVAMCQFNKIKKGMLN